MSPQLIALLKAIGWILTIAPIGAFLLFAIIMVREIASNDDEGVKGIISFGFLIFWIGVAMLVVLYGGDYFIGAK